MVRIDQRQVQQNGAMFHMAQWLNPFFNVPQEPWLVGADRTGFPDQAVI